MNKWIFLVITLISTYRIEAQVSDFKNVNFKNADAVAYAHKGDDLSNLPELAYQLTHTLPTDVEKFRAIYTWVSTNIESDYSGCLKNLSKRRKHQKDSLEQHRWNTAFSGQVFKKLLKEKKTICTGYAYLVKSLANLAAIDCEIVDGYGRNESMETSELRFPNHSWNAVKLNNKWYLCDATWSSGAYNLNTFKFDFDYNDGYFLAAPEWFAKDHYPINTSWLLTNKKITLPEFLKAPLIYNSAYRYGIFHTEPSVMHLEVERNKSIQFILYDEKKIDLSSLFIQINCGSSSEFLKPQIEHLLNNQIKITFLFSHQGTYDVHLNVGLNSICTYVIKVKNRV
ncbi:transglutaminase domain-containing protein [Flavobacterium aciduliphilum]|uniref:Transglutaminase superfamily protein n=1 Tax=Flavobacterium aciduliphilum TaxID=1101402 RepID=A0A328YIV7_9FLAO|nr:transglutaminase domain-containing protein [Flavobacterium aciduliphilum]RAR73899.1 transglutaminase superfamily protein [Flavobacterium aciduliphilum]